MGGILVLGELGIALDLTSDWAPGGSAENVCLSASLNVHSTSSSPNLWLKRLPGSALDLDVVFPLRV